MVYVNVHTLWYLSCVARVSKIIQSKYKNEFDLKKPVVNHYVNWLDRLWPVCTKK